MNRTFILLALVVAAALVTVLAFWRFGQTDMTIEFDRDLWVSETRIYDEDYPRLQMVKDVLTRLPQGMSRTDVEALLGPATDTPYFRDHDLVYWLGQSRGGLSIDSSWLVIDFENDGLRAARVLTD